jgi:hypothetical protein
MRPAATAAARRTGRRVWLLMDGRRLRVLALDGRRLRVLALDGRRLRVLVDTDGNDSLRFMKCHQVFFCSTRYMNQLQQYRANQAAKRAAMLRAEQNARANSARMKNFAGGFRNYGQMLQNQRGVLGIKPLPTRGNKVLRYNGQRFVIPKSGLTVLGSRAVNHSRENTGKRAAIAATLAPVFRVAALPQAQRAALFRAANSRAARTAASWNFPSAGTGAISARGKRTARRGTGGGTGGGGAKRKRSPSPKSTTPTAMPRKSPRGKNNSNSGSNSGSNGNNGNYRAPAARRRTAPMMM